MNRTFTMFLSPSGHTSTVILEGVDVSHLVRGVAIESDVEGGTRLVLRCAGAAVELTALLPESAIVITTEHGE